MPVVDMTGVAIGFQPIPECEAELTFTGFKNGKTKAGDNSVSLEFTVDEPREHAGHKIFLNHQITLKGLPHLKETMVILGTDPDDLEGTIDTDKILNALIPSKAKGKVTVNEFEGRKGNNLRLMHDSSW